MNNPNLPVIGQLILDMKAAKPTQTGHAMNGGPLAPSHRGMRVFGANGVAVTHSSQHEGAQDLRNEWKLAIAFALTIVTTIGVYQNRRPIFDAAQNAGENIAHVLQIK